MTLINLSDYIEVRIRTEAGGAWEDIRPDRVLIGKRGSPEKIAQRYADQDDVVEVRWNWGGGPAGTYSQGHYTPGRAHRHYRATEARPEEVS